MIFIAIIIIGFMVCRACTLMADYIDQREADQKKFYTALENDLARLDKLILETKYKKPKDEEPKTILISKEWAGRN